MHIDKTNIHSYLTIKKPSVDDTIDPLIFMHHGWRWISDTSRDYTSDLSELASSHRGPAILERWFKQDYWEYPHLRPWIMQHQRMTFDTVLFWLNNIDQNSELYSLIPSLLNEHKKWCIFHESPKNWDFPKEHLRDNPLLYLITSLYHNRMIPIYHADSIHPLDGYLKNIEHLAWLHHEPEYLYRILREAENRLDIPQLFNLARYVLDGMCLYNRSHGQQMIHHLNSFYFHQDIDSLIQQHPNLDGDNTLVIARLIRNNITFQESHIPHDTLYNFI